MFRLTGSDVKSMMEAYTAVYTPQELTEEQIWEEVENWVNSLIEEGYDLSDYTWEEMYEAYLNEAPMTAFQAAGGQAKLDQLNKGRSPRSGRVTASQIERQGQENLYKAGGGDAAIAKGPTRAQNTRGGGQIQVPTRTRQDVINRGTVAAAGGRPDAKPPIDTKLTTPAAPSDRPSGAAPSARPSGAAAPSAATAKPAPAAQTGDKAKDMETFAKANTKLAAASAERERTRGTSATTNPLMKDFKSRLPAPQTPAPSTAAKGFELASKGVDLSKPSAPTPAPAAAKPAAATPTPAPKPTPAATGSKKPGSIVSSFDPFDVVIGHLLDEGYADTEEAALAIMANMSEEWRESIIEEIGIVGPPKKGIDVIPGVRAARIAASNAIKASDYPASVTPPKAGKHVIPTERSAPSTAKSRPYTPSEVRSGQTTGSGRRSVGFKDISGD
jgi:hypothetical protein